MSKKYSLLILGYPVKNPKIIDHCFAMLTYGLEKGFKNLSHVNLIVEEIQNTQENYSSTFHAVYDYDKLPIVDFIICINYYSFFSQDIYNKLKTKCKKIISFLEVNGRYCDFSFVFRPPLEEGKTLLIPVPYNPEFYKNVPKKSKTILLDHICYRTFKEEAEIEWSKKIWQWLEELKEEYEIASLILRPKSDWEKTNLAQLPSYIKPIYATNLLDYLEKTKHFENFIVTHQGSFNYSIFDMLIRGIRVLAPPEFIHPDYNVNRFKIPIFSNEEELLKKIKEQVDKEQWNNKYKKCTPMNEVIKIIDEELQKWIK